MLLTAVPIFIYFNIMKKILLAIIMLLLGIAAYGQSPKTRIADEFADGCFMLMVSSKESSWAVFTIDDSEDVHKRDGVIWGGTFETSVQFPECIKGAQYLISSYERDTDVFVATMLKYGLIVKPETMQINDERTGFRIFIGNDVLIDKLYEL